MNEKKEGCERTVHEWHSSHFLILVQKVKQKSFRRNICKNIISTFKSNTDSPSPEDISQFLERFFVVIGGGADSGIWWIET